METAEADVQHAGGETATLGAKVAAVPARAAPPDFQRLPHATKNETMKGDLLAEFIATWDRVLSGAASAADDATLLVFLRNLRARAHSDGLTAGDPNE